MPYLMSAPPLGGVARTSGYVARRPTRIRILSTMGRAPGCDARRWWRIGKKHPIEPRVELSLLLLEGRFRNHVRTYPVGDPCRSNIWIREY